jgi:hypothetical protein
MLDRLFLTVNAHLAINYHHPIILSIFLVWKIRSIREQNGEHRSNHIKNFHIWQRGIEEKSEKEGKLV